MRTSQETEVPRPGPLQAAGLGQVAEPPLDQGASLQMEKLRPGKGRSRAKDTPPDSPHSLPVP